jgi:hypothetical protein
MNQAFIAYINEDGELVPLDTDDDTSVGSDDVAGIRHHQSPLPSIGADDLPTDAVNGDGAWEFLNDQDQVEVGVRPNVEGVPVQDGRAIQDAGGRGFLDGQDRAEVEREDDEIEPFQANRTIVRNPNDLVIDDGGGWDTRTAGETFYQNMISKNSDTFLDAQQDGNDRHVRELVDILIRRFERRMGRFLCQTGPGAYVLAERHQIDHKFRRDLSGNGRNDDDDD